MSHAARTEPIRLITDDATGTPDGYVPGACNIGPWEIRRRRTIAVAGFAGAAVLLAALVASGAPPVARGVVLLPLWGAMFSWLQARRRFCAAYAFAGIVNLGDGLGSRRTIADRAAHRADLLAVARMTRDSFLLAIGPTLIAVLLPI